GAWPDTRKAKYTPAVPGIPPTPAGRRRPVRAIADWPAPRARAARPWHPRRAPTTGGYGWPAAVPRRARPGRPTGGRASGGACRRLRRARNGEAGTWQE